MPVLGGKETQMKMFSVLHSETGVKGEVSNVLAKHKTKQKKKEENTKHKTKQKILCSFLLCILGR